MEQNLLDGNKIKQKASRKSIIYIEVLRVIAVFLVLFNHTHESGFMLYTVKTDSRFYWAYLFLSVFDKIAVPLFFMISGALLLGREEGIWEIYRKRVFKFVMVILLVSGFYYLYTGVEEQGASTVRDFFLSIYSENVIIQLWYLYAYLGFLVMLPLIRRMAQGMKPKEFIYLILIQTLFNGIVPGLQVLLGNDQVWLNGSFYIPLLTVGSITFPMMGYFLEKNLEESAYKWKNTVALLLAGCVCIGVSCWVIDYSYSFLGYFSEGYHSQFVTIPAVAVFFACKFLFEKIKLKPWAERTLIWLGSTTFGIYLMDRILRDKTAWIFDLLEVHMPTLLACIIWLVCIILIGACITTLFKKLPILKKLI